MSDETFDPEHLLRFSIEFISIKNLSEPSCIYFRFSHPLLGIGRTQSYNAAKLIESSFLQEFQSHEFYIQKSKLQVSLNDFEIHLFHNDKFQKDSLLGTFVMSLQEILSADLKKTESSYVRVLDIWLKESFADLHIILYLEDLGPKNEALVSAIPQQTNDWELQIWRKAEEEKFLAELKAREFTLMESAAADWISKEEKRKEEHKRVVIELSELESKLRARFIELQKREARIAALEEEIKLQTADMQKQVELKDQELNLLKTKLNDLRSSITKDSKNSRTNIQQAKEELLKIEDETVKLRKMAESQELKDLKRELSMINIDHMELLKRYEQARGAKEEAEERYKKMKSDLSKTLRMQDLERKQKESLEREEILKRRFELETIRYQHHEAKEIQEIKEKMLSLGNLIK